MVDKLIISIVAILCVVVPLILIAAYLSLAERKLIGFIQDRLGPHRVGYRGLFQPIADGIKLLTKEVCIPDQSNRYLFMIAPMLALIPAIMAWAVIPFSAQWALTDISVGILFVLVMSSVSVYGIIIAGWSSNSKYAFLSALRSAAQVISYEIPMGFCMMGVIMAAQSMNIREIVEAQQGGIWHWYFIPLLPLFIIYWISGIAETNRLPFDVAEGESELVAGFHVEYSGITFSLFFLAEYINMLLISVLASLMFLGGWLSPCEGIPILNRWLACIPGVVWLFLKSGFFIWLYLWIRATFPRFRYDQIMRLGWKIFIPLTLIWFVVLAMMIKLNLPPWFSGGDL